MSSGRIAAIGERTAVQGFGLAGVAVWVAEDPESVVAAWQALPADVIVVILTAAAATVLPKRRRNDPLTVVIPS